ncbi:MAG: biopolymer transporter ExbD [Verrucomicrobiae bacterium]|nr:biopolymer transporter ExbD [Verrucomicrobiae bacterium]
MNPLFRFPRKYQIFRGQFQAAPFAAVFVLLLLFLMFPTWLVYVPGLPMEFDAQGLPVRPGELKVVRVDEGGLFRYGRETISGWNAFQQRLQGESRTNRSLRWLSVQAAPGVSNDVLRRVVELARDLNLGVDLPGARLDLPVSSSLVVVTNPMVSLAINVAGQMYYKNQIITEAGLERELQTLVGSSRQPVTLLMLADRNVPYDMVVRAGAVARAAGVRQVLLATRPPPYLLSP